MPATMAHDPDAVLDYYVDWSAWLAAQDNDSITTSTWATTTAGVTLSNQAVVAGVTRTWVETAPSQTGRVLVTNHVVTAAGREDDRTITLHVAQR